MALTIYGNFLYYVDDNEYKLKNLNIYACVLVIDRVMLKFVLDNFTVH